jgi:hypothetical protein
MAAVSYFVTVRDNSRVGILFGPFETREAAESYEDNGRALLCRMGGRAAFYSVGVTKFQERASG